LAKANLGFCAFKFVIASPPKAGVAISNEMALLLVILFDIASPPTPKNPLASKQSPLYTFPNSYERRSIK